MKAPWATTALFYGCIMGNTLRIIYSPFPTVQQAKDAATALLTKRLIACANILPASQYLYHWEGEIACEEEYVLLAKTTPDKADAARDALHALHPYDVPAILTFANAVILPDYADWLDKTLNEPQN